MPILKVKRKLFFLKDEIALTIKMVMRRRLQSGRNVILFEEVDTFDS